MELGVFTNREEFDFEWVELMSIAKDLGISPEEVRAFLVEGIEKGSY